MMKHRNANQWIPKALTADFFSHMTTATTTRSGGAHDQLLDASTGAGQARTTR